MLLRKGTFFTIACIQFLLIYDSEETCGRPYYKPYLPSDGQGANRITNGIEARKHSHPWQAYIITGTIRAFKSCGGSLIHWKEGNTSDLVLTAAHCVVNTSSFEPPSLWEKASYIFYRLFDKHEKSGPVANVSNVHVFLGAHDVNRLASSSTRVAVKEIVVGEFNRVKNDEDIAILKLEDEIVYGNSIQGICLPTEDEKGPPSQSPCLVTGWGLIADGKFASTLQQVDAYVFSGKVHDEFFDKTRMICTRGRKKRTGPTYTLPVQVRYSVGRLLNSGLLCREMYNGPVANVSDVHVYLGAHDVRLLPSSSEHIRVKEIAIGEFNKVRDVEDIALLKLQKVVTYGKFIQGICLPNEDEKELPIHSHCMVAGWGLAADGKPATRLQQVDAYVFEGAVNCSFFYKDRMICARGRTNSCGPEEGDSGSPLVCLRNNTFVLYGIMAFNIVEGCSESVNKHAFMKIAYYLNWLYKTIVLLSARR
ncbi:hypothetical protein M513_05098, partial [Trichuris suis]